MVSKLDFSNIPQLDGIRGVAVLLVLVFHAFEEGFSGGFLGVDIFFMLSGFLISSNILREYMVTGKFSYKRFLIRRGLRLIPAVIFFLIAFPFLFFCFFGSFKYDFLKESFSVLLYFANWDRALGLGWVDLYGHFWSLSVEEQFYFLWPFLFIFLFKCFSEKKVLAFFFLFVVFVSIYRYFVYLDWGVMRAYNGLDTRLDAFFWGGGLFFVLFFFSDRFGCRLFGFWLEFCILIAMFFLFFFVDWYGSFLYLGGWFFVFFVFFVFFFTSLVYESGFLFNFLSNRFLCFFGLVSYPLYIWHYPIFRLFFELGFERVEVFFLGSFVSLIFSAISYFYIERFFLNKSKMLHWDDSISRAVR